MPPPASKAGLVLDLSRLKPANIEGGFKRWRSGGSTRAARASRKKRAKLLHPHLKYLHARAAKGGHCFTLPEVGTVDGRTVARLTDEDAVMVGAIADTFPRHPMLRVLLPDAYGYFGPGSPTAIKMLRARATEAAEMFGVAEVSGADFDNCFDNLSPLRAIFHMREAAFSPWRLDALEHLYTFWSRRPEFKGLVTGPASSAYLSEFALKPFDNILGRHGQMVRYSDNSALIRAAGALPCWPELVKQVLAEFNAAEGLNLTAHKLQTVTFDNERGFHQPFLMLGCVLVGHEVLPAPAKVAQLAGRLTEADDQSEARARLEGWRQHFMGLVPEWDLDLITTKLWAQECARRHEGGGPTHGH